MAVFDLETIGACDENFKETRTTTWIGEHILISVSIWSTWVQEPIFLYNLNSRDLVSSFIDALKKMTS